MQVSKHSTKSEDIKVRDMARKLESLTPREREILDLICLGHSNKSIAGKLDISKSTVEFHRANLTSKLSASSLADLIEIRDTCKAADHLYIDILDRAVEVTWRASLDGRYSYFSPSLKNMTGFDPEELIDKPFEEWAPLFIAEDFIEIAADSLSARAKGDYGLAPISFDAKLRRKDGSHYIAEICSSPILGTDGKIVGVQGSNRDVTEQRETMMSLEMSSELLLTFFHLSCDPAFITDISGRALLDVNSAWQSVFGWRKVDILGSKLSDLEMISDQVFDAIIRILHRNRFSGKHVEEEVMLNTNDGDTLLCDLDCRRANISGEEKIVTLIKVR